MLKKLKHGFTLVELVIVIAVIAVLAAVLIPTFITVIDNANNSADLQLVANMNTVLSTDLTADGTATAENLRKLLKDNGITDITTKNKDVAIIYDKTEKKFKRLNVKDTLKNGQIAFADENAAFLEANPYSAEEVFANSIVVSTGGNDFAEALYRLHNLSDDTNVGDIISKLSSNGYVMGKIASIIQTTAYVTTEGNVRQIALTKSGDSWKVSGEAINPTRVVFSESVEAIDLAKFADEKYSSAVIILPNTLKNVTCSVDNFKTSSGSSESSLLFAGNTDLLNQLEEGKITDHYIKDGNIEEAKEAVAELGAQVTRELFYVTSNAQKEFEYSKVSDAILAAKDSAVYSGKPRSVVITQNGYTIAEDITIPQNITLNIPYYHNENYAAGGSEYLVGEGIGSTKEDLTSRAEYGEYYLLAEKSIVDDDIPEIKNNYTNNYKKFEITLTGNLTVEKGGKLQIGGVTSYPDQYYQGHTSGYYGQLQNNGAITVKAGGTVDTYGYIKGSGAVTAENGGSVYQPFIVTDYTGGSNTLNLYMGGQSPFLRYAMLNIQCPLKINYGGLLWAHCNLYTGAGYNRTDEVVIGYGARTEQTKGLITLEQNSSVDCSYKFDASTAIVDQTPGNGNNLKGDIGKTTVTINGAARTEALSLLGLVSTANVLFPVPFNFDFVIAEGNFSVYNSYVILPGASVTVKSGATLTVTKDASFYVMDYLVQNAIMSGGKKYPTTEQLSGDTAGILTVNGRLEVLDDAKVGGVIRTKQAGATLVIGNADVSGAFNVGGTGAYTSNTSSYTFPLRVFDVDSVGMADYADGSNLKPANVPANSEYSGQDGTQNLSETTEYYAYKLYAEGDTESAFTAPGGTYVNKRGEYSIKYSATCGFVQTEGFSKQAADFTNNGYSNNIDSFDKAEAAINAYYQLSPKARKTVNSAGFNINTYDQTKVTQLFKTYSAYKAAFEEGGKQLDVALAVTAAWNKYQSLSQNVKSLIAEDASSKLDELKELPKNTVLFTVSYDSTSGVTYPDKIANKDASAAEKTVSLENYTQTEADGKTKTVYFTADLAPEAVDITGRTSNDGNKLLTLGTTDRAGTLFYEVWKSFLQLRDTNGYGLWGGAENVNVKFTLYSDIKLWKTMNFTPDDVAKYGNFNHGYNFKSLDTSTLSSLDQTLYILKKQNIELDLNGNTICFLVNSATQSATDSDGHIIIDKNGGGDNESEDGSLIIYNGTLDSENVAVSNSSHDSKTAEYGFFINSTGYLQAHDLTINVNGVKDGRAVSSSGIKSSALGRMWYGRAILDKITISGGGTGTGIDISGGTAEISNVKIDAKTGIKITGTGKMREETMDKTVSIKNAEIRGSWQAIAITSSTNYNTHIAAIEDCKISNTQASAFTSGYAALKIDVYEDKKVQIDSIMNCAFGSPVTAIQSTGTNSNSVVIGTMEDCTITGDKLMYTRDTVDVYGMKLEYTTVNNLKNCAIVASAADDKLATAVYVGAGSSLNMIVDSNTNNWFGAFGKMVEGDAAQSSKLFDIQGGTVTLNTSVTFDPAKNLSGAGATEFHGGYDCQKLLAE